MKKLLITTMAAVSVGLCAKAEYDGTKTSFEDYDAGSTLTVSTNDEGDRTWTSSATDPLFVISNKTDFANWTKPSRPDYWATSSDEKALTIDTDAPLFCHVNNRNTSYDFSDGPIFFDSVVQFTATDVAAEPDSADKLRVWLYSSSEDVSTTTPGLFGETSPKTCLVVTAGKYAGDLSTSELSPEDYEVQIEGVNLQPDTWHRLTIKAIADIDPTKEYVTPGFEIWVDGKPVTYGEDKKTQFPSLKYADSSGNEILQCVAFDGKGAVDDIVFTTTAPEFAQEGELPEATYTLNIEGANFSCQVFADAKWGMKINDLTAISAEYNTLWLGITPVEGWELASIKFGGDDVEIPEYDEDDKVYYLDELLISADDIANGAEYTLTITMKEKTGGGGDEPGTGDSDPETPTVGGIEIVVDATTGKITNITTADNGKAVTGTIKDDMFADYYAVSVDTDGKLVIAIDPLVATPAIDETGTDDAIVVTDAAVKLGVTNAQPGLWYGAQAYSDVACADDDKIGAVTGWVKATTTTVSVTAEKPEASAAFFKVVVDDQDHTTATPPAEQE